MRLSRGLLAFLGALALSIAVAVPAFAHPLGNFTINRFSQVQLNGNRIDIVYVVDAAAIPAFQEKQRMAAEATYVNPRVRDLSQGLVLQIGTRRVSLTVGDHSVVFLPGQGGLQTMRLQILLSGTELAAGRQSAVYCDTKYTCRLGWTEILLQQIGATLLSSTAPAKSDSHALHRYREHLRTG